MIPHLIVLFWVWIASVVVGAVALFAILLTGHYPAGRFDFKIGVVRWLSRDGGLIIHPSARLRSAAGPIRTTGR